MHERLGVLAMKRTGALGTCLVLIALFGAAAPAWPGDRRLAWSPETSTSSIVPEGQPVDKADQPVNGDEDSRRKCPRTEYINCMPPVSGPAKAFCDPDYLRWVKEHCPGVKVVY
jgi:hypothetical protein